MSDFFGFFVVVLREMVPWYMFRTQFDQGFIWEREAPAELGAAMVRQEPHRLTLPSNELVGQSRCRDVYRGGLSLPV